MTKRKRKIIFSTPEGFRNSQRWIMFYSPLPGAFLTLRDGLCSMVPSAGGFLNSQRWIMFYSPLCWGLS